MFKLSATARITLGLVAMLTSLLLIASVLGLFPNARNEAMRSRVRLSETLAVNFSSVANRTDIGTMRQALQAVAKRNPDVVSVGVRRADGELLVEAGDHKENWTLTANDQSSETQMQVQLHSSGQPWGQLEVRFVPLNGPALGPYPVRADFLHTGFLAAIAALGFYFYLSRCLQQLNPSKVVPARVREALDTLAEGLLVLDCQERIVLSNRAFESAIGSDDLIGKPMSSIPFECREDERSQDFPWSEAIATESSVTGRLLGMKGGSGEQITFSVSVTPILDEAGRQRGALASFEDVSRLEKKKQELKSALEGLRASTDEIKRQNRELEHLATRDPLTGCLNRRSFFEKFDAEWKICERYGSTLSAVMIDIDHFKSVNDNHGHAVGDDVLKKVAACLLKTARETDIVSRYGGEEFSVLMPRTEMAEAEQLAERLRQAIEALEFPMLSTTASLGVSSLCQNPRDPQDLLEQADKCLYVAKRNGRNQVVRSDQIPADLEVEADAELESRSREVDHEAASVSLPFPAVAALISALSFRDQSTAAHSRRVADLCVATGEGLMSLYDCYVLEIAALLHDIGKMGVPDSILLKPSALTAEEWEVMKHHDKIGVEILRASFGSQALTSIVENYQVFFGVDSDEGMGPSGEEIPLGARLLAIADAYDSMVTDRSYRAGRSQEEAFAELRRCAGEQFDPDLVERFIATASAQPRSQQLGITKEAALFVGLQMEGMAKALDSQDLETLQAISHRLHATAKKSGAEAIADKAFELEGILTNEGELLDVLRSANDLLEICRAAQSSFIKVKAPVEEPVGDSNGLVPLPEATLILEDAEPMAMTGYPHP